MRTRSLTTRASASTSRKVRTLLMLLLRLLLVLLLLLLLVLLLVPAAATGTHTSAASQEFKESCRESMAGGMKEVLMLMLSLAGADAALSMLTPTLQVRTPFLTLHCVRDTFVDPQGSQALFDMASVHPDDKEVQ